MIPTKVRQLRERHGWSRSELARRADLHNTTVSEIESGRLRPYDGQLRKLSRALGVPIEELVGEAQTD
jgi:transcriptional regulator with XRE-family HTH domain